MIFLSQASTFNAVSHPLEMKNIDSSWTHCEHFFSPPLALFFTSYIFLYTWAHLKKTYSPYFETTAKIEMKNIDSFWTQSELFLKYSTFENIEDIEILKKVKCQLIYKVRLFNLISILERRRIPCYTHKTNLCSSRVLYTKSY